MEKKKINRNIINPLTGGLYYTKNPRKNPTENSQNTLNPLYRPIPSKLPYQTRLKKILSVGEECIKPQELETLLKSNKFIYCYDGFEPSGRMHIAQGLLKVLNVNRLIDSGCIFIFWVADWFAMLNNKMMGDLEKIRTVGKYFVEIWKAAGMKMSNVKFLWASDFINQRPDEYWMQVMSIAKNNSLARIKKCCTIMGRTEADDLSVAQMFYPCMQCTDVFFMDVDICQLGMDQKKVNMLARDVADKNQKKPVILSSHMLPGLQEGKDKMSKSDPENAIFMADTQEDVNRKINKSFCPEGIVEKNVVLEYTKFFIFPFLKKFELLREEEHGGNVTYDTYEELEKDYVDKKVYPLDLKKNFSIQLNKILEPIRKHFATDPYARQIFDKTKKYQEEYSKYKKAQIKKDKIARLARENAQLKKKAKAEADAKKEAEKTPNPETDAKKEEEKTPNPETQTKTD